MHRFPPLQVKIRGDFACFTRPEMKVERVTYPVMTPSAARGVLEAILWKPEFSWQVREIHVLNEIKYFSILRNEVNSRQSVRAAQSRLEGGDPYFAEDDRAQRNSLALRDVAYVIVADVVPRDELRNGEIKYREMFQRRVARGQCWHQPYLGCREFSADFAPPEEGDHPIERSESLGRMLFDLDYRRGPPHQPRFFDAELEHGVLRVPASLYGVE